MVLMLLSVGVLIENGLSEECLFTSKTQIGFIVALLFEVVYAFSMRSSNGKKRALFK